MGGVDSGWVGEDGEPGRVSAMIRNESSFLEGSRCEFGFEFEEEEAEVSVKFLLSIDASEWQEQARRW